MGMDTKGMDSNPRPADPKWYLYEIECVTPGHIYVGITRDFSKRLIRHQEGHGSRFTAKHGVKSWRLLWRFDSEEAAKRAELSRVYQLDKQCFIVRGAGRSTSQTPLKDFSKIPFRNHLRKL